MLSISHRITGCVQSGLLTGAAIGVLAMPGNTQLSLVNTDHVTSKIASDWPKKDHSCNGRCMNIILIRQLRFSAEHDPGSPDWISNPLHPQVPALCPCHFPLLERIQVKSQYLSSSGQIPIPGNSCQVYIDHLFQALVMGPGIRIQDC